MAKSVQDLSINLGIEGIEGVNRLKSSLRGLSNAAGPADKELEKIAAEIKKFNVQGKVSKDVIAGQVAGLSKLRDQANLGGKAFRSLTKDVVDYQQKLKKADQQIKETTRSFNGLAQAQNQIPARKPGAFATQIQKFRDELQNTSVAGKEYTNILRQIQERTQAFNRAEARQSVIAGGQSAAAGPVDRRTAFQVTQELPKTTAALSLRLSELREDFQNVAVGSRSYVNTLREINRLEKQVADPFGTNQRKEAIRSRLGTQEKFGMFAGRDPVQSAIDRRERKRSRRYGGFTGGGLANQPVEASGLFKQIASISGAGQAAQLQMMGKSYDQVAESIRAAAAASNGSINSLQAQRTALTQLRAGLDPTSQDFRELGKEIERVDQRLGKLSKKRKFSFKGAAQTAGAVASAGIFGGPAGLAGALLGAPFGPGGAVVGGSIGATVGITADKITSFTDYAASISLAEKALERIIATGEDQVKNAKNLAIANQTIEFAVKELNVEREDATIGMTKLGAAVLGAGGNMEAAALAFLGTTTAIKATKGSAEDVRGGLTALVQMFSKGKISAEELSGQLGERFPAAVTAFAEANDISTMALQKQLKNGEVGLDKLIKFLQFAVKKYSEGALEMADSAEESGMRQKVAFKEAQNELGKQLVQVGSELQEGITQALIDLTPAIINIATVTANAIKAILDGIASVVKNIKAISRVIIALAGPAVLGLLIKTLGLATAAIAKKGLAGGLLLTSQVIQRSAIPAIGALIARLRGLLVFLAKHPILLAVMGITALGVTGYNMNKRFDDLVDGIKDGTRSLKEGAEMADKYRDRLNSLIEVRKIIRANEGAEGALSTVRDIAPASGPGLTVFNTMKGIENAYGDELRPLSVISDLKTLNQAIIDEQQKVNILGNTLDAQARGIASDGFTMPDLSGAFAPGLGDPDDPDGSGKSARNRLAAINRAGELLGIEKQILDNARAITLAQSKADRSLVHQLNNQRISLQFAKSAAQSEHEYLDAVRAANAEEDKAVRTQMLQEALDTKQINKALQLVQFEGALADEKQRNLLAEKAITEQIEKQIFNLKDQLGLVSPEEKIENFRQGLIDQLGEGDARIPGAVDLQRQIIDPTTFEKIQQTVRSLKEELEDLVNPANMIIKSADAIGTAFTDSFTSVIDGSATTQEALASFFKNIGNFFLDMAAQIIQKMITMYILNKVVGLLPGAGGFNSGTTKLGAGGGQLGGIGTFGPNFGIRQSAKGSYFENGIAKFARGGIVNSPTLFPYADGGTGRFGLMGEAGPEAILPLQRGPEGKLGVQASGTNNAQMLAAMNRYKRSVKASAAGAQGDAAGVDGAGGAPSGAAIDVRYTVERINDVDYVTAEQFQQGIQQAAQRGAAEGERRTMRSLQNSTAVRRSLAF
tara:strand:- start:858 stop:5051 length:4194 start_codon:yes stop_codon:yes gene_type:complete